MLVADAHAYASCKYREKEYYRESKCGSFQVTENENGTSTDITVSMLDYYVNWDYSIYLAYEASSTSCSLSDTVDNMRLLEFKYVNSSGD